jgi:hypothetical protein
MQTPKPTKPPYHVTTAVYLRVNTSPMYEKTNKFEIEIDFRLKKRTAFESVKSISDKIGKKCDFLFCFVFVASLTFDSQKECNE